MSKVCFVSTYPPSTDAVAPLAKDLAEELARHVNVVFLAQRKGNRQESFHRAGVRILRCWTSTFYPMQVVRSAQREGAAVVHVQHEFFLYGQQILSALLFPFLLVLLKLIRRPFVVTAHHVIPPSLVSSVGEASGIRFGFASRMFLIPFYRIFDFASTVVVPRAEQRHVLIHDYGIAAHKVCVIPHALRFKHASPNIDKNDARALIGVSAKHIILYFGYIRPNKGLEDLVRALSILRSENIDAILLVVGTAQPRYASYYQYIRESVLELGLSEKVVFAGYVPEEKLQSYFFAADVIVFPYRNMEIESSGVFLEALEFHRPIIATKVGDFMDSDRADICYALVSPSNPPELAEAIRCALTNPPRLSSSLKATHEFMARHSVENLAQDYVHLYLETIRNAGYYDPCVNNENQIAKVD